ncbi:MAG: beta-galactosidase [Chloroflexi bacterium]|nr:beta-galactosidase [Chloroflexota bacterium]
MRSRLNLRLPRLPGAPSLPVLRRVGLPYRLFSLYLLILAAGFLFTQRQWYATAPLGSPELGVNFSCRRTEYLGQDCQATLATILDDLGVRSFRLSVYWSESEPEPGRYDWSEIDSQLDALQARGARAVVSVGMRAQRFPEFWLPAWLAREVDLSTLPFPEQHPLIEERLFPYLEAATRHIAAHPAVEAIQVENEPLVPFQVNANGRRISRDFLDREVAAVRAADGGAHRIVITYAGWWRSDHTWEWILDRADVNGQSVYTKRQRGPWRWLYIFPYRIGPFTPGLPEQAREAARRGKELWIVELQAEPFEQHGLEAIAEPYESLRSISPRLLEANLRLARRSGATRAYFWGVEWWLFARDQRGDPRLWQLARSWFSGEAATRTAP